MRRIAMSELVIAMDIETVPNPDMVEWLPEPTANRSYKDPKKIAQDLENKKDKMREEMALTPNDEFWDDERRDECSIEYDGFSLQCSPEVTREEIAKEYSTT